MGGNSNNTLAAVVETAAAAAAPLSEMVDWQSCSQCTHVVCNVVLNKRCNKVVRVIIPILHPQRTRLSRFATRCYKVLRKELLLLIEPVGLQ
jgi:hypothetical protein